MKSLFVFVLVGAAATSVPVPTAGAEDSRRAGGTHESVDDAPSRRDLCPCESAEDQRVKRALNLGSRDELALGTPEASIAGFQRDDGRDAGYLLPAPFDACQGTRRAFKYFATDDWNKLEKIPQGIIGDVAAPHVGFPNLHAALARHKLTVANLHVEFGSFALQETAFPLAAVLASPDHTETRHYRNTSWRIRIDTGKKNARSPMAISGGPSVLTVNFHNRGVDCSDDAIAAYIDTPTPVLVQRGDAVTSDIGHAFLRDLNSRPVRIHFHGIDAAPYEATFAHRGAVGSFFRIGSAYLEAVTPR